MIDKEFLLSKILEHDPKNEIVQIDIKNETIQYSTKITCYRKIKYENEEFYRAYLIVWLIKEGGYPIESITLEKNYNIGRPQGSSARGDILIHRIEDSEISPYMLIEVKTDDEYDEFDHDIIKGQLFGLASQEPGISVISLATCKKRDKYLDILCKSIDYLRYPTFDSWIKDEEPGIQILPKHYGKIIPLPLIKGGTRDLRKNVTLDDFDAIWSKLHNLLWGGHLDDNDAFEWVVRLILAKIYDEKTTKPSDKYRFQIMYVGGSIEAVEATSDRINTLYKDSIKRYLEPSLNLEEINGIDYSVFDTYRIRNVVEQLQEISIVHSSNNNSADVLGIFFEKIMREGFKQSKGLYLSPSNIVFFILHAINLTELVKNKLTSTVSLEKRIPYIIDPAVGSGTFLIHALKIIENFVKESKNDLTVNEDTKEAISGLFGEGKSWAHTHLFGLDPHKSLPIAAKINMILHGDGSGHIYQKSALLSAEKYALLDDQRRLVPINREDSVDPDYTYPVFESFDVVVSNPPFSITLSTEEKGTLEKTFLFSNSAKSENLFFERWYQLLVPNGRLGVVLPESFFSTTSDHYARHFLFKYFKIKAIVSLPAVAFEPYTTTLTSLLFAQKKTNDEIKEWSKLWEYEKIKSYRELRDIRNMFKKNNLPPDLENTELMDQWWDDILNKLRSFIEEYEYYEYKKLKEFKIREYKGKYMVQKLMGAKNDEVVLSRVLGKIKYSFPIITVENVGYKRTKRSVRTRPNELFTATDLENKLLYNIESSRTPYKLIINVDDLLTALDVIRKEVKW